MEFGCFWYVKLWAAGYYWITLCFFSSVCKASSISNFRGVEEREACFVAFSGGCCDRARYRALTVAR